ncbi:MAG: hypothetical protein AAGE80_14335 [Pseudomonadota bacterium]
MLSAVSNSASHNQGSRWLCRIATVFLIALAIAACSPKAKSPDLAQIYSGVAEAGGGELRRPLITIPGTLGSRLIDSATGTIVWGGGSRGLSADPDDPEEARLIALPLIANGEPFAEQKDMVRAAGVLDTARAEILGLPIDLEVYGGVRRTLGFGGFKVEPGATPQNADTDYTDIVSPTFHDYAALEEQDPATAFRFDYDWRRDLVTLAQEFHLFVLQRKQFVADQRTRLTGQKVDVEDVTFDLLAHSMGGLIARYYLMHGPADLTDKGSLPPITWAGAEHFNRVVIVASPNAGSIVAMDNLINGKELGPLQPVYSAPLLATHASTWQLMPRDRHNRVQFLGSALGKGPNIYEPETWEANRWAMAGADAEPLLSWLLPDVIDPTARRDIALRHQARMLLRAERFHQAMDRWAQKPPHLDMFLVVGGGFETPSSAVVDPATGVFTLDGVEEGDGVVLRTSVLLDERQGNEYVAGLKSPLRFDTVLFLPDEHVELTKNPVFGDNLLFWLLEQPRDTGLLRSPSDSIKGISLPDLSVTDASEPVELPAPGSER